MVYSTSTSWIRMESSYSVPFSIVSHIITRNSSILPSSKGKIYISSSTIIISTAYTSVILQCSFQSLKQSILRSNRQDFIEYCQHFELFVHLNNISQCEWISQILYFYPVPTSTSCFPYHIPNRMISAELPVFFQYWNHD